MADVTKTGSSFATPLFSCFLWPQLGSIWQLPFYKALLQVAGWILASDVSWKQYMLFLLLLIKLPMHDPSFALSPSANIYNLMQTYMIALKNESQMEDAWFKNCCLKEYLIWILNKPEIKFYHIWALSMLRFV